MRRGGTGIPPRRAVPGGRPLRPRPVGAHVGAMTPKRSRFAGRATPRGAAAALAAFAAAVTVVSAVGLFTPVARADAQAASRNAGGGNCDRNAYNCVDAPNPVPTPNTVWIEEMTWMDVRDALRAGKTTVIIPTGGVEPNGPWLATGKHNYVLTANCDAIARKLGDALCAPIVKFVPEGRIEPPTGHMTSPGTISVREETYRAILTDVVHSFKVHGFTTIVLIGDSGGNQNGQRDVADSLNALWRGVARVLHVPEYYDYASAAAYMRARGIVDGASDNLHDDPIISLNMLAADPRSIRYDERVRAGKATINGVSIADRAQATRWAEEIVAFRAEQTVAAIRAAMSR
jgi:creatinine amidohydrolase